MGYVLSIAVMAQEMAPEVAYPWEGGSRPNFGGKRNQ